MIEAAPFFPGDVVIAVDALPNSFFYNGNVYNVSTCEYKPSNEEYYWYVGIEEIDKGSAYYRPTIFKLIESKFDREEALRYDNELKAYLNT